jgi:hypothetical protein
MAVPIIYSKKMFVQRIRKHMNDGFANDSFSTSENELILYIDSALATTIIGQVYSNAKVEGNLVMPEAYVTTYSLPPLQQNELTSEWYSLLPQPPLNLPLGYSITNAYFASVADGQSDPIFPIRNKRVPYRNFMPRPTGSSYRVDGGTIYIKASNNQPLLGLNTYVEMAGSRTIDVNAPMNVPDDALETIFNTVIMKLSDRYKQPKDIIADDLPAGNKSS